MSDAELLDYLRKNNYELNALDCLMNILNTTPQITDETYDFDSGIMTIMTPDHTFKFKWRY